tara:strand:- start:171 stop:314 length:144 start_codon:yes stop_codon:yes gene_type:complete
MKDQQIDSLPSGLSEEQVSQKLLSDQELLNESEMVEVDDAFLQLTLS